MDETRKPIALPMLTDRERDILRLLIDGLSDGEIADALVLTVGTVKWYNRQIYGKLGVHNRTQAIATAQRKGAFAPAVQPTAARTHTQSNLPAQLTSFIGREGVAAEVTAALTRSRLVTLTGPPGTGKTRLALEVASSLAAWYHDGVFAVWLAPLQDAGLVAHNIAQALGVKAQGAESVEDALKRSLRDKQLLLLLDNFEHVLAAAPLVSSLLAAAPALSVLATSRESLRLYGEAEYSVPPLQVPDLKYDLSAESRKTEAVELFVQRAGAVSPGFVLNDGNAAAVTTICVHLDGLPLAIELAAARIKHYAPQTLLVRLGSRLEALSSGPRDLPARQRTLRTTLAWSYDLLDAEEQSLFAQLGIFAGGCTTADAEAICEVTALSVPDGLESLHNKSLLYHIHGAGGEMRFAMLETMREFALERLEHRSEVGKLRERHALYFLSQVEQGRSKFYGADGPAWLARLEDQHDNLRAALQWTLEVDDDRQLSLRLIAGLARFWEVRGHFSEAYGWLIQALKLIHNRTPTHLRAGALHGIGQITYLQSDYAATQPLYEEALAIYTTLDDQVAAAGASISLGEVASEVGDYETAFALFRKAQDIMHRHGERFGNARAVVQLGFGLLRAGDLESARDSLRAGYDLYHEADDAVGTALAASGLGELALRLGRLDEAEQLLQQSLDIRRSVNQTWGIAASLGSLAWAAMLRGDLNRALDILRTSLSIRAEMGDRGGMAWSMEKFAEIAFRQEEPEKAARFIGAAAALRESVNSVIDPTDQAAFAAFTANVRAMLSPDVFDAFLNEGKGFSFKNMLDAAQ